jgi:hypothetical protein
LQLLKKQGFLLFFFIGSLLQGQITRVKGTVKDATTKETMPFVFHVLKQVS